MFLIVSKVVVPRGFRAITLFPFIVLRLSADKQDERLICHEKIHLRQQLELLIIPFYIWYVLEFFIKWSFYRDKKLAYRAISFEREAYAHEGDIGFLKKRSFW
ncbi:hypothetical protein, partial [Salmonella enterica]|uniref:hypothetical protein n=1 Tax=Salmonella enterica TaxID=28901 RepID=UPI000E75DE93